MKRLLLIAMLVLVPAVSSGQQAASPIAGTPGYATLKPAIWYIDGAGLNQTLEKVFLRSAGTLVGYVAAHSDLHNTYLTRNAVEAAGAWTRETTADYSILCQLVADDTSSQFAVSSADPGANPITWTNRFTVSGDTANISRTMVSTLSAATDAYAEQIVRNGTTKIYDDALRSMAMGTGFTSLGGFIQDAGVISADVGLSGGLSIMTRAAAPIRLYVGAYDNEVMRLTDFSNVGIGTTTPGGSGTTGNKALSIGNGTAPVGGVANQVSLYSADVSASAELFAMNEAGTTIQLTPQIGLSSGGTGADLSAAAAGGLVYKGASALAATAALSGILQGNGAVAPTAITGTGNYLPKWAATAPYLTATSLVYDDGTGVGINQPSPTSVLHTVASGAKTDDYIGNLLTNTATSSTASKIKTGLSVTSTGTWNGAGAVNRGLHVNSTGGATNYSAIFEGGNVSIGTTDSDTLLGVTGNGNLSIQSAVTNANAGTGAYSELLARNGTTAIVNDSLRLMAMGTGYTTVGGFVQDSAVINADSGLSGGLSIMTRAAAPIRLYVGAHDNEVMRLTDFSNVGIGTTTPGGSGTTGNKALSIANGTAPVGGVANQVSLYSADVSSSAELFAMDEAGNTPQLTPHPSDFLDTLPTEDRPYPWAYSCENRYLGKRIQVDLAGLAVAVEKLTGQKFVFVTDIPKTEWDSSQDSQTAARQTAINQAQASKTALAAEITTATAELDRATKAVDDEKAKPQPDAAVIAKLEADKQKAAAALADVQKQHDSVKVPDPYTPRGPPKWMADRGVTSKYAEK